MINVGIKHNVAIRNNKQTWNMTENCRNTIRGDGVLKGDFNFQLDLFEDTIRTEIPRSGSINFIEWKSRHEASVPPAEDIFSLQGGNYGSFDTCSPSNWRPEGATHSNIGLNETVFV